MKAVDVQLQMATEQAAKYFLPETVELSYTVFKGESSFIMSEEKYISGLRQNDIKAIVMCPSGWAVPSRDMGEIREMHDYAGQFKKSYPDTIVGWWGSPDPWLGAKGTRELERCIEDLGMLGIYTGAIVTGIPVNDKVYWPFYEVLMEAGVPVKISVGITARGQGTRGGEGVHLGYENPIPYVDDVAIQFPDLNIIAANCPWPFHNEMIAVLVHKANVYNELHGWSPKYFPAELKREINGRLQDRFMFGSDYPWLSHDRLFRDWEAEGYKPEVLEKVYYRNAQKIFGDKI